MRRRIRERRARLHLWLRTARAKSRRLRTPDTVLVLGWAMFSVGFGLVAVPAGLIVGGVTLAAGAALNDLGGKR